MFMFHVIKKKRSGTNVDLVEETFKHIEIKYHQIETDWNLYPDPSYKKKTEIKARLCTAEDFGTSRESQQYWKSWQGFYLICPETFDLTLLGNTASIKVKHVSFEIDRCDSSKRTCASDSDITDYLEDLNVEAWALQEKMDFSLYNGKEKPIFNTMEIFTSDLMNSYLQNIIPEQTFYISRNSIYTIDDLFTLGAYTH